MGSCWTQSPRAADGPSGRRWRPRDQSSVHTPQQVTGESKTSQDKSESRKSKVTGPRPLTPDPQAEAEAEAYFHKAIEIAQRQGAKSWELRAVMSLSRLWQQQGKKKQARKMLTDVYGWFTEGFDTADLQEAKVLLEELS